MTEAEHMVRIIEPGTPMQKVIPPRLVEPYLTGRRSVIAGYVYRARDCAFHGPANFYDSLSLGYEGSDFTAELAEIYVMRWLALDMDSSLAPPPADSQNGLARSSIPEFYTLPIPVPVGAEIHRIVLGGEEFIARYDGQSWLRPSRGL
ncbi:MAG TPA: hypothetical protein VE464_10870 [Streptosporangiaceae bacterium]|nr:hypothetical protein [Streptosporangiaceae bacterium]